MKLGRPAPTVTPERQLLDQITYWAVRARKVPTDHPEYAGYHAEINRLLTEWDLTKPIAYG